MAPSKDIDMNEYAASKVFLPVRQGVAAGKIAKKYGMKKWPNPLQLATSKNPPADDTASVTSPRKTVNPKFLRVACFQLPYCPSGAAAPAAAVPPRSTPSSLSSTKSGKAGSRPRRRPKPPVTVLTDEAGKRWGYKVVSAALEAAEAARYSERAATNGASVLPTPPFSVTTATSIPNEEQDIMNIRPGVPMTASIPLYQKLVLHSLPPEINFFDYIREDSVSPFDLGQWYHQWSQELQMQALLDRLYWQFVSG
ncbi:hypothetical protein VTN96DRAFT_672 [Rasamsonia emersonii]